MATKSKHVMVAAALGAALMGASGQVVAGDAANGEKVFKKCATCHSVEEGKRKIGPSLYGVLGRTSGTLDGFRYSKAMQSAGIVWTEETINEYIESPRTYIKGNRMAFVGLKKPEDRADVIAYLKSVTGSE